MTEWYQWERVFEVLVGPEVQPRTIEWIYKWTDDPHKGGGEWLNQLDTRYDN